ncbi:MAG: NAD(P)H-hydrate dehydratase [Microgenomates group bacterium]
MGEEFNLQELKKLFKPLPKSKKEDNGKVTIIGGSFLFHGAPILALKVATRLVDMVFFSSPESSIGRVAERIKSKLGAFIWVPFEEVEDYIAKSEAVLIGPGFMRFRKESQSQKCQKEKVCDDEGLKTKKITETLLQKFPQKQWVIDAGSLQTMEAKYIPKNAILTPNQKEFEMLFNFKLQPFNPQENNQITGENLNLIKKMAEKYNCIIVLKLAETIVCSPQKCVLIKGGNAGLTKGGTGDVLAGLTVGLAAKNEPFLAACVASWILKKSADELYQEVGFAYNADDLAEKVPKVLGRYWR